MTYGDINANVVRYTGFLISCLRIAIQGLGLRVMLFGVEGLRGLKVVQSTSAGVYPKA